MKKSLLISWIFIIFVFMFAGCKSDDKTSGLSSVNQQENIKLSKTALVGDNLEIVKENGEQQNPQVIYLRDKKLYFVVWEDWRGSDADIYGKFLKDDGSACGGEFKINSDSPQNQVSPSVAYRQSDSKLLVVWQDGRYNDTNNDGKIGNGESGGVYFRSITLPAGNIDCGNFNPSNNLNNDETAVGFNAIFSENLISRSKPKVVYNPQKDKFMVVWLESRDIRKKVKQTCLGNQVESELGDATFSGYMILDGQTLNSEKIDIIRTDTGGDGTFNVRKLGYKKEGENTETHTYEHLDNITSVDVSCDINTGVCSFVLSGKLYDWNLRCECTDSNNNNRCDSDEVKASVNTLGTSENNNIYQIYDFEFNQSTTYKKLNSGTASAFNPSISFDPVSKKFFVVWEDFRDSSSFQKIYGILMFSGAGTYGSDFIISYIDIDGDGKNDILNSKQTNPAVSYDDVNQRFFVVWQDGRNGTISNENLDIYGQYVDSEGSLRGSNYFISNHPANQLAPVIAYNPDKNEFLAVWKDARNKDTTGSDIYGQRFNLGQPQIEILDENNKSLRPALVDYGSVSVNKTATKVIKIKNIGDANLKIYDFTSLDGSPFSFSGIDNKLTDNNIRTYIELLPSAEITIAISFKPTSKGSFNKVLTVKTDAGNKDIALQGIGISSSMLIDGLSNNKVDFGEVKVGSVKDMRITITNDGTLSYNITAISLDTTATDMTVEEVKNNIYIFPYELKPGSSISLTLRYKPTQRGTINTKLYINTDSSEIGMKTVDISAKAIAPVLYIDQTALNIDFGAIKANSTLDKSITIKNTGDDTLNITSCGVDISGFKVKSCPKAVAAGSEATITYTFEPKDIVEYSGVMTIKTDAGEKDITLKGQGKGGKISTNLSTVDLGMVEVGSEATKELIITNTGNDTLTITGLSTSSPFSVVTTGNTPIKVIPGSTAKVLVKFKTDKAGNYTDTLNIISDAINSINIPLQANAVSTKIDITPSSIDFGTVQQNSSVSKLITIKNDSLKTINILSIDKPSSPFSVEEPSIKTINPGESINLAVKFNPTSAGSFSSTISILFDYSSTPVLVTLTGKSGSSTSLALETSPTILNFGKVLINQISSKSFTLKSSSSVNIVSIIATSPYKVIKTIPFTVGNTGQTITVTLNSSRPGIYNGVITLKDEAGNTYQLPLYGEVVDTLIEGVTDYAKNTTKPDITGFSLISGYDIVAEKDNKITITYPSLSPDSVIYIKTKSGYQKIYPQATAQKQSTNCVSDVKVDNGVISFKIADETCFDTVDGKVLTTIYIGKTSTSTSTPTTGTGDGSVVPPPSVKSGGGGGGGCSMAKGGKFDASWLLIIATIFGLRYLRKDKREYV